jgi:alkylhydroperoxidase family enzyme
MPRLDAVGSGTATGKTKELLDQVHGKLGFVPNMMRTMAISPAALEGHLGLSGALAGGALTPKVREHIALAVGEANGCEYVAHVALNVFTNYFNLTAGTEIDFPRIPLGAARR